LWTSTVEQLKRHGSGWADEGVVSGKGGLNPELAAFKSDLLDLEKGLQEAILRAKKQRFAIAFCGMVKAGKSLFLNALIGEPVLPSDGQ
jgi:ribosome biogenesis GTPase A